MAQLLFAVLIEAFNYIKSGAGLKVKPSGPYGLPLVRPLQRHSSPRRTHGGGGSSRGFSRARSVQAFLLGDESDEGSLLRLGSENVNHAARKIYRGADDFTEIPPPSLLRFAITQCLRQRSGWLDQLQARPRAGPRAPALRGGR